ncbi:MAG: metallophosphoesterase family protein [Candidatus Thorarchaeota archaeon]
MMTAKIVILGDTHIRSFKELPSEIIVELKDSDWIIHVGDFVSLDVLEGLMKLKGVRFKGVYGNADPKSIHDKLHSKEVFEISGKKIGITHPATGGPIEVIKSKTLEIFKDEKVDIIVYGHTHEPEIIYEGKILLINPGKGYLETEYFGPSTTIVILTLNQETNYKIKEIII